MPLFFAEGGDKIPWRWQVSSATPSATGPIDRRTFIRRGTRAGISISWRTDPVSQHPTRLASTSRARSKGERGRERERENSAVDARMRGRRKSPSRARHIPGRHVGSGANDCRPLDGKRGENARLCVNASDFVACSPHTVHSSIAKRIFVGDRIERKRGNLEQPVARKTNCFHAFKGNILE